METTKVGPTPAGEPHGMPSAEGQEIGRRTVMGLSLAATVGLFLGTSPTPVNAASQVMAPRVATSTWAKTLHSIQPARGIVKTFAEAYTMTSISQVAVMSAKNGAPKLAITMTGKSRQLQIIDPVNGKREQVFTIPENLIARGLVWDAKNRVLYVGVTTGRIYSYSYDTGKLSDLGRVAPKATSLYGLSIDSTGRLWGGSYPQGIIWTYTPKTKKFVQLPRLDSTSDYVRALAITADDTVYVGTGTDKPKVIFFKASTPSKRTTMQLTALPATGFVNKITVQGDHVLINADTVKTQLVWNHRTRKLATAKMLKALRESGGSITSQDYYWISSKVLYKTNAVTGIDTKLCEIDVGSPEHIWVSGGSVYVLNRSGTEAITRRFNLSTKKLTVQSKATLQGAGVGIHSLLAHTDGKLYIGGYQGQGIATLDPATGKKWQSLDSVAPNQIEAMIQWNATRTYIGSYGSADIIRFVTPRADEGRIAFKLMERLKTNYDQSRPFGWAKNSNRVFFGTVPEYGLAGGAFGIINPKTDEIERVYNKLIPNQSIIGLAANNQFVYGTTSTRNGYGLPDTKGNAKVFAFDLAKKKLAWSRDIPGYKAVMTPILVGDKIVAATIEGIVVMRASDGLLLQKHSFTGRLDKSYRPGWHNASVKQLGDSDRFVHVVGGIIHVADFSKGTLRKAGNTVGTGTALAVTPEGKIYVSHKVLGIAEVSLDPILPAIRSTADLVSITSSGALVLRSTDRKGNWGAARTLSTGWDAKTLKSIHIVDWQSRGIMDLLVQRTDGTLYLHEADGHGIYPTVGRRLAGGYASRQIAVGRMNREKDEPAMVSADSNGNLYLHEISKGSGVMRSAKRMGSGFNGYKLTLLDVTGKGYDDVVGHKGAGLAWWENNGTTTLKKRANLRSVGWSGMSHISAVKGHYGAHKGLMYRTKAGEMHYISAKSGKLQGIIKSDLKLSKDKIAGG